MLFLTPEELEELTGYKPPSKQVDWLRAHRYLFEINSKGQPKVLRSHLMRRLDQVEEYKDEPRLRLP